MNDDECPLCGGDGPGTMFEIEKAALVRALTTGTISVQRVANVLDVDRATIYRMLDRHGVSVERQVGNP